MFQTETSVFFLNCLRKRLPRSVPSLAQYPSAPLMNSDGRRVYTISIMHIHFNTRTCGKKERERQREGDKERKRQHEKLYACMWVCRASIDYVSVSSEYWLIAYAPKTPETASRMASRTSTGIRFELPATRTVALRLSIKSETIAARSRIIKHWSYQWKILSCI